MLHWLENQELSIHVLSVSFYNFSKGVFKQKVSVVKINKTLNLKCVTPFKTLFTIVAEWNDVNVMTDFSFETSD